MTEKAARGVGWSHDKQHRENQIVLDNLSSTDETSSQKMLIWIERGWQLFEDQKNKN